MYRLMITGRGRWFSDLTLFEGETLEQVSDFIETDILEEGCDLKGILYDSKHDAEDLNNFLEHTLTWEYLVTGRYKLEAH